MTYQHRLFLSAVCLLCATQSFLRGQAAAAAGPDPATLLRYDHNQNGRLDPDELAQLEKDQRAASTSAVQSADNAKSEEVVAMSPFEVVSDNRGYYGANTMSGTRFNSKLEDLASSITVVTPEQMADFAMLDINDVFLYTASTEGSGTFTDYNVDRNASVTDNVQLNPTVANRVRGIGPANISLGNVEAMGRTPVDPLGIDGVEISRGPNANVFGLGNPSGTLNMVPSAANLTRNKTTATLRADSYDGYRTSLDMNRVLLKNMLALRASGSFQHEGFQRKPSGMNTIRYNGMMKFQPFRKTMISASFSFYRMNGNRPNFTTPRDSISYWVANGRPTWDPINQVIHVNGQTLGPFTTDTNVPDYFNRSYRGNDKGQIYIGDTGLEYWAAPRATSGTNPAANLQTSPFRRFMSPSPGAGTSLGRFANQPLFSTTPAISSKAMYDWSSINLAAVNRTMDRTFTPRFQIDQLFFDTPLQTLAAQVGFMREDSMRYARNIIGSAGDLGQTGQLLVDVNEKFLDGTPNPFLGRPFIGVEQPRTIWQPAKWDTYRAQVAYKLNFTQNKGWTRWLGLHQFTGYDEYKYRINRVFSYRDAIADAHPWIPAGQNRGNNNPGVQPAASVDARGYFMYFLGDNSGNNVDYAPNDFKYGTYPFVWGNAATGVFNHEPAQLAQVGATDTTGGTANQKTIIKTLGGVVQSHFLLDSVVTTIGIRRDIQYSKYGNTPVLYQADGINFDWDSINHWEGGDYRVRSGRTTTKGVVVRPFRELSFVSRLDNGAGVGHFVTGLLRGLSFTYNKSDSFMPQDPKIDLHLQPLPNPAGFGRDYGVGLNLFDGKLVVRYNRWRNDSVNNRSGDATLIANRILRIDLTSTNNAFLLVNQARLWVAALHPDFSSDQIEEEVSKEIGIPTKLRQQLTDAWTNNVIAATQDITARGDELEVNYNPNHFWTVAASGTQTQSINSNISNAMVDWMNQRLPIWTTIVDPRTNTLWWNNSYGGSQTPAQNFQTFVTTPFAIVKAQEGKPSPQIRRYAAKASTSYRLAGLTDQRCLKNFTVGGALRWESRGAIGYYGKQQLPATITDLDPNHPIYDKEHYYLDAFVSYRTKLFANKVGANFQFNVRNLQEGGRLQPIGAYPDGTPNAFRIVDPRQFILSATFDL